MNTRVRLLVVLALVCSSARAYKEETHELITERAVDNSSILSVHNLERLGLGRNLVESSDPEIVRAIVRFGARAEDFSLRPVNHFFDPYRDRGLFGLFNASPDWALEDRGEQFRQIYSYREAKTYLRQAMTATDPAEYRRLLTLTFRSLGQVIHHIQDMAQPEHTRNDQHLDFIDPSYYERYSRSRHDGTDPDAAAAFLSTLDLPYAGSPVTFLTPRAYWTTNQGRGMADFTNRNFVSKDTNFRLLDDAPAANSEYPLPQPIGPTEVVPLETLMPQSGASLCEALRNNPHLVFPADTTCDVEFYGVDVNDRYVDQSTHNPRAASLSVFDQYLRRFNIAFIRTGHYGRADPEVYIDRVFSLNRFNFNSAHSFLLHRTAAYSAGLLDHFFRGDIEIALPQEGAFSVVDHAAEGGAPSFRTIKLKLRNATASQQTPDGTVELEMTGGSVSAVIRYWLNPCYETDLSGELDDQIQIPSGCSLDTYVSGQEGISVSAPIDVSGIDRVSASELSFDFSAMPIPINIRDALLEVVYTGNLGDEADAVVIGGFNISEPTYLTVFNNTDYFALDGAFYTPEQIRSDPELLARVDFNGDGREDINLDPVAINAVRYGSGAFFWTDPATLQATEYTRIAALADSSSAIDLRIQYQFAGGALRNLFAGVTPLTVQLIRDPAVVSTIAETRGFHRWYLLYLYKVWGASPPLDAIDDLPDIDPPPQPTAIAVTYP